MDDCCHLDLLWWPDVSQLQVGLPLREDLPDLFLYADASDTGWGTSLGDAHLFGSWSPLCSSFSISHLELLAVLFTVRGFLPSLRGRVVAVFSDNTTALTYLKKQGGTRSSMLSAVAQTVLCEVSNIHLLPQFILGKLNVLVDSLSCWSQVIGSECTLCSEAFSQLLHQWLNTVDLFAKALNHDLPVYFSPVVDPQLAGTDAMMLQSWDGLQAYAFPPFGLISRVLAEVQQPQGLELTLVAPFWPQHPWFPDLLELLVAVPFTLPRRRDLLRQPHFHHYHQNLPMLQLTAWRISSDRHAMPDSLKAVACQLALCRRRSMRVNYQPKWAVCHSWCHHRGHSVSWQTISKVADFLLYPRRSLTFVLFHRFLLLHVERCLPLYSS